MKPCPTCGVLLAAHLVTRLADTDDADAICPSSGRATHNESIVRKDEK